MEIPFIKIDNAGNDYVYIDRRSISRLKTSLPALARLISARHSGVGSDGMIIVEIIDSGSARIRIFNSDGSEAELCGNGLRGAALFMMKSFRGRRAFSISTEWEDYRLELLNTKSDSAEIGVNLGSPSFEPSDIGILGRKGTTLGIKLGKEFGDTIAYCMAMPNPHAVIFVDNFDFDWQKEGAKIERARLFRNRINVMFARIDTRKKATVLPWERGSGATMACGSGSAAVCIVSRMLGYTENRIIVAMPGGKLVNRWDIETNEVYQSGPSRVAFSGFFKI